MRKHSEIMQGAVCDMKCGFYKEDKECTEECKYFNTCTRNPHRKDGKNVNEQRVDQTS